MQSMASPSKEHIKAYLKQTNLQQVLADVANTALHNKTANAVDAVDNYVRQAKLASGVTRTGVSLQIGTGPATSASVAVSIQTPLGEWNGTAALRSVSVASHS